jgi:hypothetical protein
METLSATCVKLLKINFESLIQCFKEQEALTQSSALLLRLRAEDIVSNSIEQGIQKSSIEVADMQWIIEATTTFVRFFPENITGSGVVLLDEQIDLLFARISALNDELSTLAKG